VELDWSTFWLEIVNFLILVWILKRFLYRPVLDFIARRRAETEEAMDGAARAREESERLRGQYENRLRDWSKERDAALSKLRQEMDQERARRLEEIRRAIEEEREKARVAEERHRREFRTHAEETALELATRFAGRILEHTSGAETTRALATLAAEGMNTLDVNRRASLREAGSQERRGTIQAAHELDAAARAALEQALGALFGADAAWEWQRVPELLAGVRVELGSWELTANVRDELRGFTALVHGSANR
jgi:F-type H+-transporting ATPase subunit b